MICIKVFNVDQGSVLNPFFRCVDWNFKNWAKLNVWWPGWEPQIGEEIPSTAISLDDPQKTQLLISLTLVFQLK